RDFDHYLNRVISPRRSLGVTRGLAQRATASGARIFQVLDREPRMTTPADANPLPPGNGHVEMRGVTLRYEDADELGVNYASALEAQRPDRDGDGRGRARITREQLNAAARAAIGGGDGPAPNAVGRDGNGNGRAAGGTPSKARARRAVLCNVDLDVPPGRTIAVVGATGSGKTSLVSLISRLYDVS